MKLPITFVRSGNVNLVYGQGRVVGEYGYGWSRTANSSTVAYGSDVAPMSINLSVNYNRYNAFPSAASTQIVPNGGKRKYGTLGFFQKLC